MEKEYKDPLVSWEVADKARDIGFNNYCVESFVRTEEGNLDSQYTGLIPEEWAWECYKPSLGQLRTWISDFYNIEIKLTPYIYFINRVRHKYWKVTVLTGDSLTETSSRTELQSFDMALNEGLHLAIKWIIKIKNN